MDEVVHMAAVERIGLGLIGAATTMVVRRVMRRTLHRDSGEPKLPRAVRRSSSVRSVLLLAGAAGALLAIGDVLQEQRKLVTQRA